MNSIRSLLRTSHENRTPARAARTAPPPGPPGPPSRPARSRRFTAATASVTAAVGVDRVFVPAGAHAGQLTLEPCDYSTERGDYAADCGPLVVRENRADPGSRLIALPVTRIHAIDGSARADLQARGGSGPHEH
jgi:hypothetical protein